MIASVVGARSPSARSVAAGVRAPATIAWNIASAAIAGSTTSSVVSAGPAAELGEQVAAQQRAGGLLEQHLGLPAVGHVRGARSGGPACRRGR